MHQRNTLSAGSLCIRPDEILVKHFLVGYAPSGSFSWLPLQYASVPCDGTLPLALQAAALASMSQKSHQLKPLLESARTMDRPRPRLRRPAQAPRRRPAPLAARSPPLPPRHRRHRYQLRPARRSRSRANSYESARKSPSLVLAGAWRHWKEKLLWEINSRDKRPAFPAEQNIPRQQFAGTYTVIQG